MNCSISLSPSQRKTLLRLFRSGKDVQTSRRAQILLLLDQGLSYRHLRQVTFASFAFIAQCVNRFQQKDIDGIIHASPPTNNQPTWLVNILDWLEHKTPQDFGYFRTRWSCETLAEVLAWDKNIQVSAETIRRALRQANYVWRRPRPVLGRTDPDYDHKHQQIQHLLATLPENETAVFQDEVDIHLNPKIGSCWMRRGEQAEVVTPGNNEKRHLAGSLVWRSGTLLISPVGIRRNAQLFIAHLEDLRRRLRSFRVIHVICDNAAFHHSRAVQEYVALWSHRIVLHYLPTYAPQTNPIERIWWRLHETLTRNHRCGGIDQLVETIYTWVETRRCFFTQTLADYATAI